MSVELHTNCEKRLRCSTAFLSMATISSTAFATSFTLNQLKRPTPLAFSTSVSFSYNLYNRIGLGLSANRRARRPAKRGLSCNCLFGLGVPELVVIAGVTVLLFGPKKLPEVGRSIGKTIKGFQQAAKEFESELKKDEELSAEPSSEKITEVSEEEKQESKVPSRKESS